MVERLLCPHFTSAQEIGIKNVLPGTARHRTRFNLAQTDVAQGKDTQGLEQRPGNVFYRESNRSLVGAGCDAARFADEEETREVPFVILEAGTQDGCSVLLGGFSRGDGRGIAQIVFYDMLHAACRVVKSLGADLPVLLKEFAALIEGHRMRQRSTDFRFLYTPGSDQIMNDTQVKIALYENLAGEEKIEVLGNRAAVWLNEPNSP